MTREEIIEYLDILKKSINETVGNRFQGEFTYIANVKPSSAEFVIQSAIDIISKEIRPTGKWIEDEFGVKCSHCNIHTHLDKFGRPMKFLFCSMCGADMRGEECE